MRREMRVLRDYYAFTIPNISAFAGAILGILFVLRIKIEITLGIFALVYGLMLLIVHLAVYPHFKSLLLYRAGLFMSIILSGAGAYLVYMGVR